MTTSTSEPESRPRISLSAQVRSRSGSRNQHRRVPLVRATNSWSIHSEQLSMLRIFRLSFSSVCPSASCPSWRSDAGRSSSRSPSTPLMNWSTLLRLVRFALIQSEAQSPPSSKGDNSPWLRNWRDSQLRLRSRSDKWCAIEPGGEGLGGGVRGQCGAQRAKGASNTLSAADAGHRRHIIAFGLIALP